VPSYTSSPQKAVQELTESVQQQVLDAIRFGQDTTIDAIKGVVEVVQPYVPDLAKVPYLRDVEPKQVVEATFGFVEKVLEAQKDFVTGLLSAIKPVVAPAEDASSN
jgi:hypothetical protein